MQAGTYGQWGALLAGGDVIYPTGYGTLITAEESTIGRANMSNWIPLDISRVLRPEDVTTKPCKHETTTT